ncbi:MULTISPECIES: ABC transporter substrate-binding protein [unclassified Pseudonocardia]|nr:MULTISPECIES: ABC transporter substrate-binding protein [unclassified Pseudonocardia]OLM31322.1 Multiple sugar ABC transporter, substrate-binding protein [Pseudonocardia sp. Ae717_Ps2]
MKAPVRSRRGWRRLVAAAAVAGVVAVSAACGPGDGADSGDGTRFTYWSMWRPTEPQGQVLQSSIDQFTRDTGITVDVRWQGRRVLDNLAPSLPQGADADLVDQSRTKLRTALADTGQSADLTAVLDQPIPGENKKISEVIPPKYRPFLNGRDGRPYLIPYEVTGEALWLDAARYPDIAAKPPENWDDFVAVLARIQASGVTPIALDTNKAFWPLLVLQRALGPQDLVRSAGDRTGEAWNAPAVLDAIDRLEQLVRSGYFGHAYTDAQFPAGQIKWAQGRAALFLQGSWLPSEAEPYMAPSFRPTSIQLPAINGGDPVVSVELFGFAIPRSAKNGAAAQKFIAYFMNRSQLEKISERADNLTPRADIPAPRQLASLQSALSGREVYPWGSGLDLEYGPWTQEVLDPPAAALMQGEISAVDFVAQMKQRSIAFWKNHG